MESPRFWEKGGRLLVFWLVAFLTYAPIPSLTPFAANKMSFTSFDATIPFVSWMALFYVTLYPHTLVSFFIAPNRRVLHYLFLAFMFGGASLAVFYFFFPTLHESQHDFKPISIFDDLVALIRFLDLKPPTPTNLLPSGHVFFTLLPAFFYLTLSQRWRMILLGSWGLIISLSTLMIKQHTAIDVVLGLILAALIGMIFGRMAFRSLKRIGQKPVM